MMKNNYFLESSAFTKRYTRETGCDFVDNLFQDTNELFYLSITYCEIIKVFYRLYKYPQGEEQQISEVEFNTLNSKFAQDLLNAKRIAVTNEIINKFCTILTNGYIKSSIDILHIAGFLITKEIYSDLFLVTADNDLADLAKRFSSSSDIINLNKM